MRAVQIHHARAEFELVAREVPEPKPGEVRIRVQGEPARIASRLPNGG